MPILPDSLPFGPPLTRKQFNKYNKKENKMPLIKNEEDKCPYCDNEYDVGVYHVTNKGSYYDIDCSFCGFEGKEHRSLQFEKITDLDDEEVTGWKNDTCQYCGKEGGH